MSSPVTDPQAVLSAKDHTDATIEKAHGAAITAPVDEVLPHLPTHNPEDTAIVAAQAATTIEAEDGPVEDGYESSSLLSSGSTSVSSGVRDYDFENGKRYHKYREGSYLFPNDDAEQDREDMKHAFGSALLPGKPHSAPIEKTHHNIIDLGTRTRIWTIGSRPPALMPQTKGFSQEKYVTAESGRRISQCIDLRSGPYVQSITFFCNCMES